ncbi:MAG: hypothetical protein ACTTJW_07285 [Sphaerochaeta sp.]
MRTKDLFLFLCFILTFTLLSACSVIPIEREIEITIPKHPWENVSGKRLWYTLKWTCGDGIKSLYISPEQRKVSLKVPAGETVLIAAYPLSDMNPFGGAVTPLMSSGKITLSQNDGAVVNELMNIDRQVTQRLNYGLLSKTIQRKTDDFRCIEKVSLLRDIQNGVLGDTSVKKVSLYGIESLAVPCGLWTSEFLRDQSIPASENMTGSLELPEGVFRYLNTDLDRVLVVIVDSAGRSYNYFRQSLL